MPERAADQYEQTRAYLTFLLDHEDECTKANCPLCRVAQSIYDLIRAQSPPPKWPAVYPWDEPTTIQ